MTPGIHLGQGNANIIVERNKGALSARSGRSNRGQHMNHLISVVYGKLALLHRKTPMGKVIEGTYISRWLVEDRLNR